VQLSFDERPVFPQAFTWQAHSSCGPRQGTLCPRTV
jgi:hypothetical protein